VHKIIYYIETCNVRINYFVNNVLYNVCFQVIQIAKRHADKVRYVATLTRKKCTLKFQKYARNKTKQQILIR